jgi:hypothetical protein
LENSDAEVDINAAWETIIENIKFSATESLGYYELKQHKPRLDEGKKWLQESCKINLDNLINARREPSQHFRNKKREHQEKIDSLQ